MVATPISDNPLITATVTTDGHGLRLCVLASGSSGNCTWVASANTAVLIDAGLSGRRIKQRLETIGGSIDALQAVCISHEHQDHIMGLRVLQRRHNVPAYANAGTAEALARYPDWADLPWNIFTTGHPFTVGDLTLKPFSVPHDAYDPVGFIVEHDGLRAGIVTDMGMATGLIREQLRNCQLIVLESNHDELLLRDCNRPWSLKQRIRGRQGHLSNQAAANLLTEIAGPTLQQILLAHLSDDCNEPDLALASAQAALEAGGHTHIRVGLTYGDRASECCCCVAPVP